MLTSSSATPALAPSSSSMGATTRLATETVLMRDLRAGDIVQTEGVRVRLTTRYETYEPDVVGWQSEYVGCVDPTQTPESLHGGFGRWFREGWAVQGRDTMLRIRER